MPKFDSSTAAHFGSIGGQSSSAAKVAASRLNGCLGGRPRGSKKSRKKVKKTVDKPKRDLI